MTRPPYDAVLCDIDGVLRHWPSAYDLEQAHGLPAGAFATAAFAPARLRPTITGQVTDEQWRSTVAADLAENYGSPHRARIAVAAWSALLPTIDTDIVALLTQTRDVAPVALVSNATTRLEADLEQQVVDLRGQLAERDEELDAARTANRELIANLNKRN